MKKSKLMIATLVLVSVSTLSSQAFAGMSSQNPRLQSPIGTIPRPQSPIGTIPRPQSIIGYAYTAFVQLLGF